ncbi:metalloregulator ArsR/SmtB family transcription factor [Marinobacter lutaoensis]|uniref:metalloregulator ArsR/SmtB family transcription factor n=1 Tax=Marinobacter lutaoensis TaxID=135739 RepID=UPI0015938200|nr:metalloregulator ArsR/SmtB family transcription factor [Marinobacter lutaoensis]NVD35866.1 metalloregulator ArsR/SmtB family transcription factor [Marinobacter lutaoensis]
MKKRVLFVCTANSARSLMAEALLRDMAGDRFEVASAGTEPGQPHPLALEVLQEAGMSVAGLYSKPLSGVRQQDWDYVITLCEQAARECLPVASRAQRLAWDFPDPAASQRRATFARTLKELKERIRLFVRVHQKETRPKPADDDPVALFKAMGETLRLTALLLIRDQGGLCVCELTEALAESQPKVSRHLAVLRAAGLLETERRGQWIFYHLPPGLPGWVTRILEETARHHAALIEQPLTRLRGRADRPAGRCA